MAVLAACSTDSILEVDRPDVIDPGKLSGAAGATALYNGALGDVALALAGATTGAGGGTVTAFPLLAVSGFLSDEFRFAGQPPEVRQFDVGSVLPENSVGAVVALNVYRARTATQRASAALSSLSTTDPRLGETHALNALVTIWIGENYCSGAPLSTSFPTVSYSPGLSTAQLMDSALAELAAGKQPASGDPRVAGLVAVLQGRALLNQGRFAEAATAVAQVPTGFVYQTTYATDDQRTQNAMKVYIYDSDYISVSDREGQNGLDFASAGDPRVPTDDGGISREDGKTPVFRLRTYNSLTAPVINASGIEARLIEAEAALNAGDQGTWLAKLNEARASRTDLAALVDPGPASARVDLMFRERAFWLFATAHRVGDLRRLVRQYGRAGTTVFPTGPYHKDNLTRGDQESIVIPAVEANNPLYQPSDCDPAKP